MRILKARFVDNARIDDCGLCQLNSLFRVRGAVGAREKREVSDTSVLLALMQECVARDERVLLVYLVIEARAETRAMLRHND